MKGTKSQEIDYAGNGFTNWMEGWIETAQVQ